MMRFGRPELLNQFEVGSFSRRGNIEGEPKKLGNFPAQGQLHFSFWVWFYTDLGKPQPFSNFKVASFSRCRNIKGEPHILYRSIAKNHAVTYFCHLCNYMMCLIGKPKLCTKF